VTSHKTRGDVDPRHFWGPVESRFGLRPRGQVQHGASHDSAARRVAAIWIVRWRTQIL